MDVAIDGSRSNDQVFSRNHFRRRAHEQLRIHPLHGVGIAGFADLDDAAIAHPNIPFDDAPVVNDECVGNHQVERARLRFAKRPGTLPHAVANGLAAAEGNFVAVDGEVPLHLQHQIRIRETNPIPCGWAI